MNNKRDLLLHYDEENQKFVFYMVDVDKTSSIRSSAFDGVCPEVEFFKSKAPDEAERTMGAMVFAALDHGSMCRVNIRDYKEEAEVQMQQWVSELEVAAEEGDPEAQFNLYMEYHSRTMKSLLMSDLQRAEVLLLASVDSGYAPAVNALKDWPVLKAAAERRIQRGHSST